MRMIDIITKKRDGGVLTEAEIKFFIKGYVDGIIPDYQASALLMAIVFKGMNKEETAILTREMMLSGDIIDLSNIEGVKVDKHSTGGVGDKTSLVLGPLVASFGVKVAKMSGRGLGHTGGTIDKLESIPGTQTSIERQAFIDQVNTVGCAIIGQTGRIVPADKKLYALRDVTGTVESIPLIAASIMSKKLAAGSSTILLDVKFGSGAFMKTLEDARQLARTMVEIGNHLGRDTRAILTDMDQPLGLAVGNSLEVIEAIETLHGRGPKDFVELCYEAAAIMLEQANVVKNREEALKQIDQKIKSGEAFEVFKAMIKAQGGDTRYLDNPDLFEKSKLVVEVKATTSGYVEHINSLDIGVGAMKLGAGRQTKDDVIDMSSGVVLKKKVGDFVKEGETLCVAYTNKEGDLDEVLAQLLGAFKLSATKINVGPIIHDYIR
jgi:pyrimidine-nucleoside phosphorylase